MLLCAALLFGCHQLCIVHCANIQPCHVSHRVPGAQCERGFPIPCLRLALVKADSSLALMLFKKLRSGGTAHLHSHGKQATWASALSAGAGQGGRQPGAPVPRGSAQGGAPAGPRLPGECERLSRWQLHRVDVAVLDVTCGSAACAAGMWAVCLHAA